MWRNKLFSFVVSIVLTTIFFSIQSNARTFDHRNGGTFMKANEELLEGLPYIATNLQSWTNFALRTQVCNETACEDSSTRTKATNIDGPSEVRNLTLSFTLDFGINMEWEAPKSWNGPAGGYVVVLGNSETGELNRIDLESNETSTSFYTNHTDTLFLVFVGAYTKNINGSIYSELVEAHFFVPEHDNDTTDLELPEILELEAFAYSVNFQWSYLLEDDNNGSMLFFEIMGTSLVTNTETKFQNRNKLSVTFPDLIPNSKYISTVQACRSDDRNDCGVPSLFTFKTPSSAPFAPTNLECNFVEIYKVQCDWSKPILVFTEIKSFKVTLYINETEIETHSVEEFWYLFDELEGGTHYYVGVFAEILDDNGEILNGAPAFRDFKTLPKPEPCKDKACECDGYLPLWVSLAFIALGIVVLCGAIIYVIRHRQNSKN